ncbi:MAG: DNA alkylation repair protein [Bacteroidota bacterium]|nr:DNA alkylation repair protein [Bacteroidota bacterium]
MSYLLKDLYTDEFFRTLTGALSQCVNKFDGPLFQKLIFDKHWKHKELKDRMRHVAATLYTFLPKKYSEACRIIIDVIKLLEINERKAPSFLYMFFPDFLEKYGINHFSVTIKAMEKISPFTSCEFAVRPFLLKYPEQMMAQMIKWSQHKNEHMRRLSSEGSRPRLPWAMSAPFLKINPKSIIPILVNLKSDPSEYVRRSVANNLNDISKDHPKFALSIFNDWIGINKNTDQLIKHAARSLLKSGHPKAMNLFGLKQTINVDVLDFKILTPKLKIGQDLIFSFSVIHTEKKPQLLRLEYAIYYLRLNGSYSKKVFKLNEKEYFPNHPVEINKKQSFKLITTKTFYLGAHKISLIINGIELNQLEFTLYN